MPIDFRTYTDPGVYIESITPPVVFTAAIEPTILAIVGEAPSTRDSFESTNLVSGTAVALTTLGGDPETLSVKDRLLGTPYVSAAIGEVAAIITAGDASWTNSVTTYDDVDLPTIDGRVQVIVLSGYDGTDAFKFTINTVETGFVTRGTNHTSAGIKTVLEAHADVIEVNVYATTDASVFAIEFVNPVTEAGDVTISSGSGGTTGASTDAFLALVDEEVVAVTTAAEGLGVTWTVVRGIGSADAQHTVGNVINGYQAYDTYPSVEVAELAAPITSTDTTFTVNELYGVQDVDLGDFAAADTFTISYGGQTTGSITYANYVAADGFLTIQEALVGLTTIGIGGVQVTSATDTNVPAADPNAAFRVRFLDPNETVTALTITPTGFTSGGVTNRGVASDTYLDIEGERMLVTSAISSAPQTLVVTRGVNGTVADSHGALPLYENTGADYTVAIGVGDDAVLLTADDTTSLLILGTRISTGSAVNVSLEATDEAQFSAGIFDDLDTIRDKYGDPLDSSGQINSELTLGAQLALANGATQLVLIAVNPDDTDPVQDAIDKLAFEQAVNSVALLGGVAADITFLKGHVEQMSEQGLLRRAFVGVDSTPVYAPASFIQKAAQLNSERTSLVAPSQFKLDNGTSTPLIVPGYFGAAAVAGLQAGLPPQEPLTRKQVFGFLGVNDQDTSSNIFQMQAGGVLVVFQDRLERLIIKHGLTTDMTSVYTREISVVTSRDRLRDFVLETLEGGALIGSPMTSETPNMVMAAVNSALEESVRQGLIFDYSDVKFRYPTENPTMIQVRFSYKPTLPLNYIHVQFSIDTNTGTVEFQNINDSTAT